MFFRQIGPQLRLWDLLHFDRVLRTVLSDTLCAAVQLASQALRLTATHWLVKG